MKNKETEELSDEQIEEFREAFSLFDPDGNGYIQTKELGTVLRSLGIYISNEEKNEFIEKYDPDGENIIYFKGFLEIVTKKVCDTKPEEELLEALKLFESEKKNIIDIDDFSSNLREFLPDLDDEQINGLCNFLKQQGNNFIHIPEAILKLCPKNKNLNKNN